MFASAVFYAGLVAAFVGLLATIRPIARLRLTNRVRGLVLTGAGVVLVVTGLTVPAPVRRVTPQPSSRLDELVPVYQFNEVHATRVAAPPERVYEAMRNVTAGEIALFQLLTWIRRFGRSGPENILNAPANAPILDVATRTGFLVLAAEPPRELVVGTVVLAPDDWRRSDAPTPAAFRAIHGPGFATATMNFSIAPDASGSTILSTETRVYAADARSRRRFAVYWRIIYPGSALIRRGWLRAIRLRAERAQSPDGARS